MKEAAEMFILNETEKTVQNTVHPATKSECNPLHGDTQKCDVTPDDFADVHEFAGECRDRTNKVHWALLDLNQKSQGQENKEVTKNGEIQRVQKSAHFLTNGTLSGDLQRLILVWDSLPENVRKAILTLAGVDL